MLFNNHFGSNFFVLHDAMSLFLYKTSGDFNAPLSNLLYVDLLSQWDLTTYYGDRVVIDSFLGILLRNKSTDKFRSSWEFRRRSPVPTE